MENLKISDSTSTCTSVSTKDFAKDISHYLYNKNLDIELNVLAYKEYKFNFGEGKFERTQKSLIPVINGIGNVSFSQREAFRDFNLYLFSEYEKEQMSEGRRLNFRLRYSPINRHFIAGDKITSIENLFDYERKEKVILEFNKSEYNLIIFTTPLHFNYNPDLIKKLRELDELENKFSIYLVFITGNSRSEEYDELCQQFIDHYKFTKLIYLQYDNYDSDSEGKTSNCMMYKHLNLQFDLTDPTKFCFFINKEGLILSDFLELNNEKLINIKQTVLNKNEDFFLTEIKQTKRFNYKVKEEDLIDEFNLDSKFSKEEVKLFNQKVKSFSIDSYSYSYKKNNFITIQVRKYFDINKNKNFYNEKIGKISLMWALSKKNYKIYEMFVNWSLNVLSENFRQNLFNNGTIVNHREKLISKLKMINDEVNEHKIEERIINKDSLKVIFQVKSKNGLTEKIYSMVNSNIKDIEADILNDNPSLVKLSQLENEFFKEAKSPAYIFNELFLIPRLNQGDNYIPINKKHLTNVTPKDSDEEKITIENNQILIYYFFTAWSSPSLLKLKELNKIATSSKDKRVVGICIDSNYEELKENLIYNIFGDLNQIHFEIYFANTADFEVYQKVYRAYKVNNNLVVVDKNGKVCLIDNFSNVQNLAEQIKLIEQNGLIEDTTDTDTDTDKTNNQNNQNNENNDNSSNKIINDFSNFQKTNFAKLIYSHDFIVTYKSHCKLNENFQIVSEKLNSFQIDSNLRSEEDDLLNNFLKEKGLIKDSKESNINNNIIINRKILETQDLDKCLDLINDSNCSICNYLMTESNFSFAYYCPTCNNLTCSLCQPKHEHNLVLFRTGNKNRNNYKKIDSIRLGDNLVFYGSSRNRNHQAGCNKCETIINDKSRFICLNCLPGKTPVETGYNDYCEDCMKLLMEKWRLSKDASSDEKVKNILEQEEEDHLYLRLDYSVTYFGY